VYDVAASSKIHPEPDRSRPGVPGSAGRIALNVVAGGTGITLVILGLGLLITHLLQHSAAMRADLRAERWLAAHRSPVLDHLTLAATWLAETPMAIAVAIVAFLGLRLWLGRWRESWVIAVAVLGELCTFLIATALIDRARPPVHRLDGAPPTSSFPSGHTGAAVAIYLSLAILLAGRLRPGLKWPVGLLLGLLPVAVGLSRLYRGMHYPTDVLAGALNGGLWLALAFGTLLATPPKRHETHR
jgi:membrane-associated phospholipid phosphatase